MREAIQFYAPDWELVLIWIAIASPAFLVVLLVGRSCGLSRAAVACSVFVSVAIVITVWLRAAGVGPHLLYILALPLPLFVGSLWGLLVAWGVWGR